MLDASPAWAQDDEDEDEDEDDEGDDDEGDDSEEEEEEEEEDPDQPPVTAGGLYTLQTYPQGEIQRPLTMTQGIHEMRAGIGFDISNKTAFETFGLSFDYRYGYRDNVELQAGFKGIQNFDAISGYAAFEGSIVYDLVDFRTGFQFANAGGETVVGVPIGFPFRYAPKEQVAVTALETAFEIQFDSKPDATPSIGIVVQPAPIVAILVKAAVRVTDFDFSDTSKLAIPATIAIQLSPNNKIDAGMDFTFNNLKPAPIDDGMGGTVTPNFYDDRFLLFFGQIRM
ncbi:MAG: hypothetical protein F9K40_07240 [Kofleriaceae bacterium]|nr:MAG: hypothetical protein F9K40_07240 [Kofleriaceae bacterium]